MPLLNSNESSFKGTKHGDDYEEDRLVFERRKKWIEKKINIKIDEEILKQVNRDETTYIQASYNRGKWER